MELMGLSQAFALAAPRQEVLALRGDLVFYQALRPQLLKHTATRKTTQARVCQCHSHFARKNNRAIRSFSPAFRSL
jgi:hypothetical protein